MNEPKLGNLITSECFRDAIHVAVAPVVAGEKLAPGQDVGFREDTETVFAISEKLIGIVDPFLKEIVLPGQRFWLFLYPQTITSLRHNWTHPAFAQERPSLANLNDKETSEIWLRAYAMRVNTYDKPQEAYERLLEGLQNQEYFAYGTDCHGFFDVDDADELKRHAEAVLGHPINWSQFSFSCSC